MTDDAMIYYDLIGGASGDMMLAALLDAGLELPRLRGVLEGLSLPGWSLQVNRTTRRGIAATQVVVTTRDDDRTERHLEDMRQLIAEGPLALEVKTRSLAIITRLAEAEARIHAQPVERVHLHEVGGIDTIVDIVGTVAGLDLLGIRDVVVSPFPLARGQIEIAHGRFPLPAPATLELVRGAPIVGVEGDRETVTPTAAAILTTLATAYGPLPRMRLQAVGYGAGARDDPTPNVLRVVLGEANHRGGTVESLVELETNIDDMNPQWFDYVAARLFEAGALDVTLTPLQMKKNRPATGLRILAPVEYGERLRAIVLDETTTLGVREHLVERYALERETVTVETEFGTARAKLARRPSGAVTISPEYDDCAAIARARRIPVSAVYEAVVRAARDTLPARTPPPAKTP